MFSDYFVKGQAAKIKKCAWIVTVCDSPDVDMHVFTEVTMVLVAIIGMAKLSKILFLQTSPFHLCSFSSYYSHFFLFLTLFLFNYPKPRNSERASQSEET